MEFFSFISEKKLHFRLTIYLFIPLTTLAQSVTTVLSEERYRLYTIDSLADLINCVEEHKEQIDCLVVINQASLLPLFNQLYEQGILLPVVIIDDFNTATPTETPTYLYHSAEVRTPVIQLEKMTTFIEQAITQFLHLGPNCSLSEQPAIFSQPNKVENKQSFLLLQQQRLAEKLKERLGYLGVYYKRNPQYFYRNLLPHEKKELLEQLKLEYHEIILNYFTQDFSLNSVIDQFVNRAFFADISVSQVLEIHMELMDQFSQQLKLEGRNEEILLDYRLALIDILAHIGEMYRRSIPREDTLYDLLFKID